MYHKNLFIIVALIVIVSLSVENVNAKKKSQKQGNEKNAAEKKMKKDKHIKQQHLKESSIKEQREAPQLINNVETGKSNVCSLPNLTSENEVNDVNVSSERGGEFESTVNKAQQQQHQQHRYRPHIMKPKNLKVLTEYDKCKLECKRKRDEGDVEEYLKRLKYELEQAEAALSEQKQLQQQQEQQQQQETITANTQTIGSTRSAFETNR